MEPQEVVRRFIAAWNTSEAGARLDLLRSCCVEDAEFVSTLGFVTGVQAQSESIGKLFGAFPKARVLHGEPNAHHGFLRFRWQTDLNDGSEPFFGEDVAELAVDGRIRKLVSFDGSSAPVEP